MDFEKAWDFIQNNQEMQNWEIANQLGISYNQCNTIVIFWATGNKDKFKEKWDENQDVQTIESDSRL